MEVTWVVRMKPLHGVVVQVTEHAVVSGDEVTAVVAFETFLDLLEVPASWMGTFFPALVKLSVETASNTQLEFNTREQALQVRCLMLLHCRPCGRFSFGVLAPREDKGKSNLLFITRQEQDFFMREP